MIEYKALYFGFIVALAIGPGALLIIHRGFSNGLKSAVVSGLGAAAGDFISLFMLTLSNPLTILVFIGFLSQIDAKLSLLHAFTCAVYVFIGSAIVQLSIAWLASRLGVWFQNNNRIFVFNLLSGIGLLGFGISKFI